MMTDQRLPRPSLWLLLLRVNDAPPTFIFGLIDTTGRRSINKLFKQWVVGILHREGDRDQDLQREEDRDQEVHPEKIAEIKIESEDVPVQDLQILSTRNQHSMTLSAEKPK